MERRGVRAGASCARNVPFLSRSDDLFLWILKIPYMLRRLMFGFYPDTLRVNDFRSRLDDPIGRSSFRSRAELQLELLALRHQLHVLNRSRPRRLRLVMADRWLWTWLSRAWPAWRTALVIVKPETVIA